MDKKLTIRCRGIILYEGKLLVVKHQKANTYYALPGGHLEWSEGITECVKREITEELEIAPQIGRLLYVYNFIDTGNTQSIEFFFEIKNGAEYVALKEFNGSHKHELAHIHWVSPAEGIKIMPEKVGQDFREGKLIADEVRYITVLP